MSPSWTHPRRGAALFVVLVFVALISGLAGVAMRSSSSGVQAAAVYLDQMRADALGRAVPDMVAYYIRTGDSDLGRGGAFDARVGDATVSVTYLSESARIDANAGPVALIKALLSAGGASPDVIATASERITKARARSATSPAAVPAPAAPGSQSPATRATAATEASEDAPVVYEIQTIAQISELWGLPKDVSERVADGLTVATHRAAVDPTLAGRLVLTALIDGDPAHAEDYLARRKQGFVNSQSALALLPQDARRFSSFKPAPAVRALAVVRIADRLIRRYETVLISPDAAGQPTTITSWRRL